MPFFHNMAQTITDIVGEEHPDAVIATTITSYALSSMLTGAVFYLMGKFNFGYMVGFIPRHILIGCIGGVGWFLIATGFEVSARMSGSLEYDLDTLRRLIRSDTVLLWVFPLVLAIALFWGQSRVASKYFLPLYIIAIPIVFYFFVTVIDTLDVGPLREKGWIFEGPPADEPWWYFWTLYSRFSALPRRFLTDEGLTPAFRIPSGQVGCHLGHRTGYAGLNLFRHPSRSHQRTSSGASDRRGQCRSGSGTEAARLLEFPGWRGGQHPELSGVCQHGLLHAIRWRQSARRLPASCLHVLRYDGRAHGYRLHTSHDGWVSHFRSRF